MIRPLFATGFVVALAAQGAAQTKVPSIEAGLTQLDRIEVPEAVHRALMTGPTADGQTLHLSISLAPIDSEALETFVKEVSDPSSPNYRRFLTPVQVGSRFGVSAARVAAVEAYLKSRGMTIRLVAANRLSILADATVAQAERAFDTTIANFRAIPQADTDRAEFFSNTEAPKLPFSFASSIVAIGGLDNATKPVPRMALTPTQTRSIYKAAGVYGAGFQGQGRNIAISNFDGYRLSNVPLYYTKYALPTPAGGVGSNVKVVAVGTAAGPGAVQGEGDLDIQMVLGMAPLCSFTIYDSTNDLIGVLTREVNDNTADIISESYGWRLPTATANAAHNLHLSMSAQGITYMAASGDNGTDFKTYDYPDFEPEVLLVGGTVASVDANGVRTSEVGWSGSGGGYSTYAASFNTLPSWQKGAGVPTTINKRLVPDISLHASGGNSGAYPFYLNGSLTSGYVGTSFACPVQAGLLGIAAQRLDSLGYFKTGVKRFGRIQDLIYAQNGRSDVWTDITSGANGNRPDGVASVAGVGWDSVTGWGAMNVDGFVAALAATIPNKTFYPTAVSIFSRDGTSPSGDATSLKAADGNAYTLNTVIYNGNINDAAAQAQFALPAGTTGSATITIVASAPAGTYEVVMLHNYKTGATEYLSRNTKFSGTTQTMTFTIPDLTNYISSTGEVGIVERSQGYAGAYTLKIDQMSITLP